MKLPPHSSPDRPHGVRWLVLPGAALTMLFALLLLFQPQRDGLILWPCAFDATPEAVVLLAVCVVIYVAAALLLMRTWSDAPTHRQRIALIVVVVVRGLALVFWLGTRLFEWMPGAANVLAAQMAAGLFGAL